MKVQKAMTGGALLGLRLALVSAAFVLALSSLSWSHADAALSELVQLQNRTILIASIVSVGFSSIVLFYASRGRRQGIWSLVQFTQWLPAMLLASAAIAILLALKSHGWNQVFTLTLGTVLYVVGTTLPSYYIGRGRISFFAAVEIFSTAAFAACVIALVIVKCATPKTVTALYILLYLAKSVAYMLGDNGILPSIKNNWSLRPNIALIRRFGILSWATGAATALIYRGLLFEVINTGKNINKIDALFLWSILDRGQNLIQVINTLAFRNAAASKGHQTSLAKSTLVYYPPISMLLLLSISCALFFWYLIRGEHFDVAAFWLLPLFFLWGLRSLVQNLLLARRHFAPVILNATAILLVAGGGWLLSHSFGPSFATLAICSSGILLLSSAHLTWRLQRG